MNVIKYFNAPTLVEYSNYWLKAYKTGIRTNTRHNYEMIIRKFRKADVSITHLSKNDYLTILEGEPDYTKTRIALTIKQIIKCAISDGYLKADSIDRILGNITLPKTQPKITKRALTELETRPFIQ